MELSEAKARLEAVAETCKRGLDSGQPILTSTYDLLRSVIAIAEEEEELPERICKMKEKDLDHIIASCDASIKENPGGPAAVGVVIERPVKLGSSNQVVSKRSKATTNNQAEYEAVYLALVTIMNLHNNPGCEIEIRSDSKLVIDQLNNDMECHNEKLKEKRDGILEFVKALPIPVRFVWRPRNSTPELREANYAAQDELGVPRR